MSDREKVIGHFRDAIEASGNENKWRFVRADIIEEAIDLLNEQKSEWLEDSIPGQEYGTAWACAECGNSICAPIIWNPYRAGFKYCPFCGDRMVLKRNDK